MALSHNRGDIMASHRIQFQQGMPIPKFLVCFGTEVRRVEAVKVSRWPSGFHCARCNSTAHHVMGHGAASFSSAKIAATIPRRLRAH